MLTFARTNTVSIQVLTYTDMPKMQSLTLLQRENGNFSRSGDIPLLQVLLLLWPLRLQLAIEPRHRWEKSSIWGMSVQKL
jgi:hypothetical protein